MDEIREMVGLENEINTLENENEENQNDSGMSGLAKVGIIAGITAAVGGAVYGARKIYKRWKENKRILKEYYEAQNGEGDEEADKAD